MKGITSVISFCVLTIFATATWAQDDVCDGQIGAAFGLCNAYCEAMDCDSDEPNANLKACDKVYENFLKHTGEDMPCEVEEDPYCPCFNSADLEGGKDFCSDDVPGFPGLAAIVFSDGNLACSGPNCNSLNVSCAITANSDGDTVFADPITDQENQNCQTLILASCNGSAATLQSALPAGTTEVSSIPFIEQ